MMKDLLSIAELGRPDIDELLSTARELKSAWRNREKRTDLEGRFLTMIFHKPSLRTRVSFETAMYSLGGVAYNLTEQEIGLGKRESIHDVAKVLSRMTDAVMIRTFSQKLVEDFAASADVPVINALTDLLHPCQILSDLFTLSERGLDLDALKIAYVGDGNNVANSWINAALHFGFTLSLAVPDGYDPDESILSRARERGRGSLEIVRTPEEAVAGADLIYTDTWTSMGQEAEAEERRRAFRAFQVNRQLLEKTGKRTLVMHCLPAHRGEEITDEVMDGQDSIVYEQAEGRLLMQRAILRRLILGN